MSNSTAPAATAPAANVQALNALVDAYCASWRVADAAARGPAMAAAMTADMHYCDPTIDVRGLDELSGHVGRLLQRFPNAEVVRTSNVDAHHGMARFAWRMVLDASQPPVSGIDVVTLSEDGTRIRAIVGFFGPLA